MTLYSSAYPDRCDVLGFAVFALASSTKLGQSFAWSLTALRLGPLHGRLASIRAKLAVDLSALQLWRGMMSKAEPKAEAPSLHGEMKDGLSRCSTTGLHTECMVKLPRADQATRSSHRI